MRSWPLLDSAIDALAYAHAQGVVHRDSTPGTLSREHSRRGPSSKILDFGVAKVLADAAIAIGPTARTVGNVRMFAPAYGAPEQFDDRSGAIGPWTDVYAIALVVLEALADRTVMEGEHLGEFATKALDSSHRPSPRALGISVGDATEKVFVQALALDPSRRPRDAGEFWGMLKNALQVDARFEPPPQRRTVHARHASNERALGRLAPSRRHPPNGSQRSAVGERAAGRDAAAVGRDAAAAGDLFRAAARGRAARAAAPSVDRHAAAIAHASRPSRGIDSGRSAGGPVSRGPWPCRFDAGAPLGCPYAAPSVAGCGHPGPDRRDPRARWGRRHRLVRVALAGPYYPGASLSPP